MTPPPGDAARPPGQRATVLMPGHGGGGTQQPAAHGGTRRELSLVVPYRYTDLHVARVSNLVHRLLGAPLVTNTVWEDMEPSGPPCILYGGTIHFPGDRKAPCMSSHT